MSTGSVPARDSLIARFHRSATRFPDRDAIVEGDRVVSYAEAANTARRWAGMLHALLGHPPEAFGHHVVKQEVRVERDRAER